ncbi:MAG TPA: DUF2231 domain-containing protein [Stellaceae bacterium]
MALVHHDRTQPARDQREEPLRGVASNAAVFGHPIHPVLIPFPVASLIGALGTDIAYRRTGDAFWARASRVLIGAGIATGAAAAIFGAIDYSTIRRARRPVGTLHAIGNGTAMALAIGNFASRRGRDDVPSGGLALSAATAALVGLTSWAGTELSYRHMVGVVGHDDQLSPHDEDEHRDSIRERADSDEWRRDPLPHAPMPFPSRQGVGASAGTDR